MKIALKRQWLIVAGALAAVLILGWLNYRYAASNPGGADFLVHWVGTRNFFAGESPYSEKTAIEIQQLIYGQAAKRGEHQFRVVYPLYSTFLFYPFSFPDLTYSRVIWMTFLEVCLIILTLTAATAVEWRPPLKTYLLYVFFGLGWYFSIRALINGNVVVVIALCLSLVYLAVKTGNDATAGVLLAISTIKPNLALLPVIYLLIWAISMRRWKVLGGFLGLMTLFLGSTLFLYPTWPIEYWQELIRFSTYNPPTTVGAALEFYLNGFGSISGWIIRIILTIMLVWNWWRNRKAETSVFLWVYCFTLVVSQWIGITTDPGNFMILFLPIAVIIKSLSKLQNEDRWISAWILLLFIEPWVLFLTTMRPVGGQFLQSPAMFFSLPPFVLAGLLILRGRSVFISN